MIWTEQVIIIWANDGIMYRSIYVSLSIDKIINMLKPILDTYTRSPYYQRGSTLISASINNHIH